MSWGTGFPTRLHVYLAKTQISLQVDKSLRNPPWDALGPWPPTECPAKTDLTALIFRLIWQFAGSIYSRVGTAVPRIMHYENTPIQIYGKFHLQKTENFQLKNSDIFHISAQNIDCGYPLEPPRRGGSNGYPQSMLYAVIRKIMYTPVKPSFTI